MTRFVLQNGMTVIVNEVHAYPIAASVAYLKASLAAEADLMAARVLQQLMLKGGTPTNPGASMMTQIGDAGGTAYSDSTIGGSYFVARIPSGQIKQAISLQADLIQNAALLPSQLGSAIEAAQAKELACCQDAARYAEMRVASMSLGLDSTAGAYQQISMERLRALYAERYKPQNLILVITGDVATFDVVVQIEQLYGQFGVAQPTPEGTARPDPQQTGSTYEMTAGSAAATASQSPGPAAANGMLGTGATTGTAQTNQAAVPGSPSVNYSDQRGTVHQTIVTTAYRAPGLGSPDWAAAQVLADLMARGPGSRLATRLVIDQAAARALTSDYLTMPDTGVLTIQMLLAPELIDKAEAELFKTIDRVMLEPPAAGDLAEARSLAEHTFYDRVAAYDDRALFFAVAEAGGRPPMILQEYADLIRAVTATDVQQAARQYLSLQNTSVFEYEPVSAAPRSFDQYSYARTVEAWAPAFEQASPKTPPAKHAPIKRLAEADALALCDAQSIQPLPVKDFSTLNGPRAYVREDHSLPMVTIALLFQGGRLTETPSNSGITELMLRSMLSGTRRLNSSQLSSRLADLGAEVEVISQPDYFGFAVSVLSANSEKALKSMHDVVEDPALADADIESARKQQTGVVLESRDRGPAHALELLLETIYPGHPYSLPTHGIEQAIGTLKPDQVRDWYEKTVKVQYPLVIVVGDTQGSQLISEEIAGGFNRRTLAKSLQALVPRQALAGQKVEQTSCGRTLVGMAFPGPRANSPDLPVMEVIASAIHPSRIGLGEGYGDGDSLYVEPMLIAGAIYSIQTIKSKDLPEVRPAFAKIARGLADKELTEGELKTARTRAEALRTARLYFQHDLALEYAEALFSGQQASSVDSYAELLSKVAGADVRRVATTYLKPDATSFAVLLEAQQNQASPPQKQ